MSKKYLLLLLVSFLAHTSRAQDKTGKIHLQTFVNIGLINGSKGSSMSLQTIIGGALQKSFVGLGVGLDYYRFRTVPVFADLRHEFGNDKRSVFLYGDIGYALDWLTDKNREQSNMFSLNDNYKGGLYYDVGIGYKFGFKNSDALILSAGYTFKTLKNELTQPGFCPFVGPCHNENETYRYYLSRLILKAGWRF